MATISSIGVGSGLPLATLLENLRKAEELPLGMLAQRKQGYDATLSAYGVLKNSIESLQKAATELAKASTFSALTSTSSNPNALSATITAGGAAVAGQYTIEVGNLATTQNLSTVGQASRDTGIGSGGEISITIDGTTKTLTLGADTSLDGLRAAINAADLGVTASIVNDGDPNAPFRLVLSANDSGTKASVSAISVSGNAALNDVLGYGAGTTASTPMTQVVEAKDAHVKLNGIDIVSGSNTLSDTIDGVSLQLLAPTAAGAPITLKVESDNSVALKAAKDYVEAYNALQSTINRYTNYDAATKTGSPLTGDSTARNLQTQTRNMLIAALENSGLGALKEVGLSTTLEGNLELDEAVFTKALAETPQKVNGFFSSDTGLAKLTDTLAGNYIDSDGALDSVTKGIQSTISDIEKQFEQMEVRVEDNMARYKTQYAALDALVAQMQSTSAYLTQQLSMLNNNSSK